MLIETGHDDPDGPWLRIGVGIHSGPAFVGVVAVAGEVTNFTALGDTVNATARLASAATAGEVLISESALHWPTLPWATLNDASCNSGAVRRRCGCGLRRWRR